MYRFGESQIPQFQFVHPWDHFKALVLNLDCSFVNIKEVDQYLRSTSCQKEISLYKYFVHIASQTSFYRYAQTRNCVEGLINFRQIAYKISIAGDTKSRENIIFIYARYNTDILNCTCALYLPAKPLTTTPLQTANIYSLYFATTSHVSNSTQVFTNCFL